MKTNATKRRLKEGTASYGVGMLWPSPEIAELMGGLGFDWLWLDLEHGPFDHQALYHTVRAADAVGLDTILRLPKPESPGDVLPFLEVSPMGVIVPHTQSAKDVDRAVQALKYPPVGTRSAGAMRGAGWGTETGFAAHANRETMVMALVEDEIGIENLDEILAVDELDAVVIGYGDLSLTMGRAKTDPEVRKVGRAAQEKVIASGKALQVTAQNGDEAREWIDKGALMVRCTMHTILQSAARRWLESAKNEASESRAA